MSGTRTAQPKPSAVAKALARDRIGVPAVLFFVLAGVAPLTVAAGVIPTAYATTGLTAIPAAFVVIAAILGVFATGYVAMARHITNAGSFYAFIAQSLGRVPGVAAALAFHNTCWRSMFALTREGVLPAALARTGASNIPRAASLTQSATGLATIAVFALAGWPPMTVLFFWLGTTGGFCILLLLAVTSLAVIAFFGADPRGETGWARMTAPAVAAVLLAGIVVLAVGHYNTLLGVAPGSIAAWALPAAYAAVAATGTGWGLVLKARRPRVYATIGLGAHAVTGQTALTTQDPR